MTAMQRLILTFNAFVVLANVVGLAIAVWAHNLHTQAMQLVINQLFTFSLASLTWCLLSIVIIHSLEPHNTSN